MNNRDECRQSRLQLQRLVWEVNGRIGPSLIDLVMLLGLQFKNCREPSRVPKGTILICGDPAHDCSLANLDSVIRKFSPPLVLLQTTVSENHTISVTCATSNGVEVPHRAFLAFWQFYWVGCSVIHNVEQKKLAKAKAAGMTREFSGGCVVQHVGSG